MAPTLSAPGRRRGLQSRQDVIRWRCVPPMKKATLSPTSRSGIQEGISGIALSGKKSLLEVQVKGRTPMKKRVRSIFLPVCGVVMAASLVFADLKKGYYAPTELGSLR